MHKLPNVNMLALNHGMPPTHRYVLDLSPHVMADFFKWVLKASFHDIYFKVASHNNDGDKTLIDVVRIFIQATNETNQTLLVMTNKKKLTRRRKVLR